MNIMAIINEEMQKAQQTKTINISEQEITEVQGNLAAAGYEKGYDAKAHRELAEYCCRLEKKDARGLFLFGHCGTGKTLFMQRFIRERLLTATDIMGGYLKSGLTQEWEEWVHGHYIDEAVRLPVKPLVIDDLGAEPTCRRFGETREILEHVLSARYLYWKDNGVKTYVTSNLTGQQLDDKYGRRITDRLREMCFVIKFDGKSARANQ